MRVIIAGSRGITDAGRLNRAILAAQMDITHVISGGADGVDKMGEAWARLQDPKVPVTVMPARWDELGKRAGAVRNCQMAKDADGLIALWDGISSGTRHMITEGVGKGLYHYIDSTCGVCGMSVDVAIYRLNDVLRAMCRKCLVSRGADVTFFDVFGMWGNHTLHVTEKRLKPPEPKLAMPLPPRKEVPLKFGDKKKAIEEYRRIRKLESETGQLTL